MQCLTMGHHSTNQLVTVASKSSSPSPAADLRVPGTSAGALEKCCRSSVAAPAALLPGESQVFFESCHILPGWAVLLVELAVCPANHDGMHINEQTASPFPRSNK
jgi:hypothetical protein